MSKGTNIISVRLSDELVTQCSAAMLRLNPRRRGQPMVFSDFIRAALVEKLSHMKRSREKRKKKRAQLEDAIPSPPIGI